MASLSSAVLPLCDLGTPARSDPTKEAALLHHLQCQYRAKVWKALSSSLALNCCSEQQMFDVLLLPPQLQWV